MPGLLGTGKNLRSFIKGLLDTANAAAGDHHHHHHHHRQRQKGDELWRAFLLDLRCHGKSAKLPELVPPHTLETAAGDVVSLMKQHRMTPEILIGHSFGGKTCLEILRQLASDPSLDLPLPRHVWVLDSKPGLVNPTQGVSRDVLRVLNQVESIPLPVPSREWLYRYLDEAGFSKGLQQWLGSNLVQAGKHEYEWIFNLEGAKQLFESYCTTSYWDLLSCPPKDTTIHIVRAAKSDRWPDADVAQLKQAELEAGQEASDRGRLQVHTLADAGHWMHSDNPKGLIKLIAPSLLEIHL